MDLGFNRLGALRSGVVPIPLDYYRLVASLSAMQAASRTATVEAMIAAGTFACTDPVAALVRLFCTAPGWTAALAALNGSFHPGLAAESRDPAGPAKITSPFTVGG